MKLLALFALFMACSAQAATLSQREMIENVARTALMNRNMREDVNLRQYPSYEIIRVKPYKTLGWVVSVYRRAGVDTAVTPVYVSNDARRVGFADEVNPENGRVYLPIETACDALKSPLREACENGTGDSIKCSDYPGDLEITCAFDNMNPKNGKFYRYPIQREEHPEAP